jgi:hypothetical protein
MYHVNSETVNLRMRIFNITYYLIYMNMNGEILFC